MRILFTCIPGRAHSNAMIPLVHEAMRRGHDVAVATAPTFGVVFAEQGVPVLPSGWDWSQSDPSSLPEFHHGSGPPMAALVEVAGRGVVDDLLVHIDGFKPDVLVWDAMEFGGWIAAEISGLPQASFASAMGTPRPVVAGVAGPALVALARRYGLPVDPGLRRMFGHLYIHRKPRILDFPYGEPLAREVRYRPSMFDRPRPPAPDCLSGLDERPLVHLSLGTTFATTPAGRAVLSLAMRALATEPVNLVVSTGPVAPGEFDPVPDNVRLVSYVDHEALLPRCALFLSHGSFSSILVSIAAGVPMCFLPLSADQPVVSMHLANLGLGVNLANVPQPPVARLDPATLREQDVRAAVRRVLDDDRYRRTVAAVRDAFLALPGLDAVMSRIGDLPSDGRQ